MKALKNLLLITTTALFLVNCSSESLEVNQDQDSSLLAFSIKDQTPNQLFDSTFEGLYHGVVASGTTQSRGKIWINLRNDALVNAYIEMIDGTAKALVLTNEVSNRTDTHYFSGSDVAFELTMDQDGTPNVTNFFLNNEAHFVMAVKDRSQSRAAVFTGTFSSVASPGLTGTWNLVSDGTNSNPNGLNGDALTGLMITHNSNVYTDNVFEPIDYSSCFGSDFIPVELSSSGGVIVAENQTSVVGGVNTSWSLFARDILTGSVTYLIDLCVQETITAGSFTRNGISGEIFVD